MNRTAWDMAEREDRAGRILHAYRERRRIRRGDDTWFGDAEGLLSAEELQLAVEEVSRRRLDLVSEAVAVGMAPELAELLYDIAREEGLDPVLGLELVRCGLGALPPREGVENASEFATSDKYRPTWLEPAMDPDTLLRERTLRVSFRRLRGLLEQHGSADEAFSAFAREPDVGQVGY